MKQSVILIVVVGIFNCRISPQDTLFFFFASHGVALGQDGCLLTVDTVPEPVDNLALSALKMSTLRGVLDKLPASRVLIAVDACRNDPRSGRGSVDNRLEDPFARSLVLRRKAAPQVGEVQVTATLFACRVGQRSYEWPEKGHGFFSYFLSEGLRGAAANPHGVVTLSSLLEYLETHVPQQVKMWKGAAVHVPWAEVHGVGSGRWELAGVLRAAAHA